MNNELKEFITKEVNSLMRKAFIEGLDETQKYIKKYIKNFENASDKQVREHYFALKNFEAGYAEYVRLVKEKINE